MKRYNIKSQPEKTEYLEILTETDEGYNIRLTSIRDGNEKIREDFISHHLFELCLKTGYLSELAVEKLSFSAA